MFGPRIKLFRLLGFEVRADASWLIIFAMLTWTLATGIFPFYYPGLPVSHYSWMGLFGALFLFASIVIHELFHSLVARHYGIPMKGITLFIFGGIAEMEEEPDSARAELLLAIAGPIASVLLGVIFLVLEKVYRGAVSTEVTGVLAYLARINWILAAFNMLPAFPMDGGRVLRALLWRHHGNILRATRTACRIGSGFGIVLMSFGALQLFFGEFVGAVWWFVIGVFVRSAAMATYDRAVLRSALHGEPVSRYMHREPYTVTPDISVEELVQDHMYRYHHRMFPVLSDADHLDGCVTSEQVKVLPRAEWPRHTVKEIVEPCSPENTITPDTDSVEALKLMQRSHHTRLMVVDRGRLVAIVALRDLMGFLSTKLELLGERPLKSAG